MFKLLFISTMLLAATSLNSSQWEQKKDQDGIKISFRTVEGSSFKEYKGETTIQNTSLTDVLDIIFDVDKYDISKVPVQLTMMNGKVYFRDGL